MYIDNPPPAARYEILRSCLLELMQSQIIVPVVPIAPMDASLQLEIVEWFRSANIASRIDNIRDKKGCEQMVLPLITTWTNTQVLYLVSYLAINRSGRQLRKLPLNAHACYVRKPRVTLEEYLLALLYTLYSDTNDPSLTSKDKHSLLPLTLAAPAAAAAASTPTPIPVTVPPITPLVNNHPSVHNSTTNTSNTNTSSTAASSRAMVTPHNYKHHTNTVSTITNMDAPSLPLYSIPATVASVYNNHHPSSNTSSGVNKYSMKLKAFVDGITDIQPLLAVPTQITIDQDEDEEEEDYMDESYDI